MIEVKRRLSNGCEVCPELWDGQEWVATVPGSPHLGFDSVAKAEALAHKLNSFDELLAASEAAREALRDAGLEHLVAYGALCDVIDAALT